MSAVQAKTIELTEYEPTLLEEFPFETGLLLWRKYGNQVAVEFPSPKTGGQWQLTSQGWVGHVPLTRECHIVLKPKVDLGNLFRMLEYAYRLRIEFLPGLTGCSSLEEFYERLASILARRVLDRGRKGFYRAYVPETERLPYVCGQIDVCRMIRTPWDVKLQCSYEEHCSDIEDNQILAWALSVIARSGIRSNQVLATVREAYRLLQGTVTLSPFGPRSCVGRLYNRLNDDYRPLHGLSRFFLEHTGPSHQLGNHTMLPFMIHMGRLYELFVAEWLRKNLREDLVLKMQETVTFGEGALQFKIDLLILDRVTGETRYVLDTKYKKPSSPSSDDVAQVVAYATAKRCREAVLVYPAPFRRALDDKVGDIRVRSLTFAIDGDLDQAGDSFLDSLLAAHSTGSIQ